MCACTCLKVNCDVSHSVTGGWDTNNIVVVDVNDTFITCNSTHLTSFAVLVDVTGGTSKQVSTQNFILLYYNFNLFAVCDREKRKQLL